MKGQGVKDRQEEPKKTFMVLQYTERVGATIHGEGNREVAKSLQGTYNVTSSSSAKPGTPSEM